MPLHGLVAATHTPMHADGTLNLGAVEGQGTYLARSGVAAVFIGGTTGECASLTLQEVCCGGGGVMVVITVRGTGMECD